MIYIKGNVPSSKNSKQWTGRMLINSKTVRNYLKVYEYQFIEYREEFIKLIKNKDKPLNVCFYFIRDSKRRFDYVNVCQLPLDLMVKHKWIDDDNAQEIIPIFKGYEVDKSKAGVIISVL